MIKVFCDRCDREAKYPVSTFVFKNTWEVTDCNASDGSSKRYYVCKECTDEFDEWWVKSEPEPKTLDKPS